MKSVMYVKYRLAADGPELQEFFSGEYTVAKCLYEFKKKFANIGYDIITVGVKYDHSKPSWINPDAPVYLFPKVKKRRVYFGRYID